MSQKNSDVRIFDLARQPEKDAYLKHLDNLLKNTDEINLASKDKIRVVFSPEQEQNQYSNPIYTIYL